MPTRYEGVTTRMLYTDFPDLGNKGIHLPNLRSSAFCKGRPESRYE